jgi:hypothetical protein
MPAKSRATMYVSNSFVKYNKELESGWGCQERRDSLPSEIVISLGESPAPR